MAKREIGTKIALDGEKEYKQALSEAMNAVKLLGLEVKENTTTYGKNTDSVKGNQERIALLSQEIDKQKQIIELYNGKLADMESKGETNSKAYQELQEKLIKARTALAAMNNDMTTAQNNVPSLSDKVKQLGANLATGIVQGAKVAAEACAAAMAAIGAACVSAGKAIFDLTGQAGQYADTILTMSQTTGVAAEDLQKWEYAGQFVDTSVETITGSLTKLTSSMTSSSASTAEAFKTLKVKTTDASGHLRSNQDVFWDVIDALGEIENETERDQLAMSLLGKSAKDLNPLIIAGSDAFKQLGDEAKSAGLIMSDESLAAFGEYDDAVNQMKSTLTAAGRSVAEIFLPATKQIINSVTEVVSAFVGMVKGVDGSKEKLNSAITNLINNVTSLFTNWMPQLLDTGVQILTQLIDGIIGAIPKLTESLPKVIEALLTYFVNSLPKIIDAGIKLLTALIEGIVSSIPNLVAKLPEVISAIVKAFTSYNWGELGGKIITGIASGLRSLLSMLSSAALDVANNGFTAIKNLPQAALTWGKDMIQGFINGIKQMLGSVKSAVSDLAKTISSFLHFSRPDVGPLRDYEEWMPDMVSGMVSTLRSKTPDLEREVANLSGKISAQMGNLNANVQMGVSSRGYSASTYVGNAQQVASAGAAAFQPATIVFQVDGREFARVNMPYFEAEQGRVWQRQLTVQPT